MNRSTSIPSSVFSYPVSAAQPLAGQFCYDESDVILNSFNTLPEGAVMNITHTQGVMSFNSQTDILPDEEEDEEEQPAQPGSWSWGRAIAAGTYNFSVAKPGATQLNYMAGYYNAFIFYFSRKESGFLFPESGYSVPFACSFMIGSHGGELRLRGEAPGLLRVYVRNQSGEAISLSFSPSDEEGEEFRYFVPEGTYFVALDASQAGISEDEWACFVFSVSHYTASAATSSDLPPLVFTDIGEEGSADSGSDSGSGGEGSGGGNASGDEGGSEGDEAEDSPIWEACWVDSQEEVAICDACCCSDEGDAESEPSVPLPGAAGEPCGGGRLSPQEAPAVLGTIPAGVRSAVPLGVQERGIWTWRLEVSGDSVAVVPPAGAALYFEAAEGEDVLRPAGVSRKRCFRGRWQDAQGQVCAAAEASHFLLAEVSGVQVLFEVVSGAVCAVRAAEGGWFSAQQRALQCHTFYDAQGQPSAWFSAAEGLLVRRSAAEAEAAGAPTGEVWLAWYAPEQVVLLYDDAGAVVGYSLSGEPFKEASFRVDYDAEGARTTSLSQWRGASRENLLVVSRRVLGNVVTITKGC